MLNSSDNLKDVVGARTFVDETIEAGEPWTDPAFPPEMSSIANEEDLPEHVEMYKDLKWKRASQLYDAPQVFIDGIEPSDINQGNLSNCYYLCTLATIAQNPARV